MSRHYLVSRFSRFRKVVGPTRHHAVLTVRRDAPALGRRRVTYLLGSALRTALARHPQIAYVAACQMPDHVELIIQASPAARDLAPAVRDLTQILTSANLRRRLT